MEMNSFTGDKVGPGGETSTPKKTTARKSTAAARNKDPTFANHNDSVSFQIYEVLGNIQEHLRAAGLTNQDQNPDVEGPNIVLGNEVVLSLTKADESLDMLPEDKFVDITCKIEADNVDKEKYLPLFGDDSSPYKTFRANKMIIREAPRPAADGTNAGAGKEEGLKVCGSLSFYASNPIVRDFYPLLKRAVENERGSKNEKSADGVSSKEETPKEGVAGEKIGGVIEGSGSDTGTKNGSFAPKENSEKNTENKGQEDKQDVPDRVPDQVPEQVPSQVPQGNPPPKNGPPPVVGHVEEVVVSSGFAWGRGRKPKVVNHDTSRKVHGGEDYIAEVKMNESGSLEIVKRYKRDAVGNVVKGREAGNAVEFRKGVLVEKTAEEDRGAIQDEEIGSVAGEIIIEDGNKRKRIPNGEETNKLNPKKRKVEKSKNNDSNGFGDGKDKGSKKDSAKPGSSIYDQSTVEETIDRVASGHLSLPFLENLRGEIKNLSRADLEELIVQKLCEVVTERSAVGHLRKRAEALEKSQERWKEKVLSLTKQIREMDMVMKNYLSEVRRHQAEKSFQMVAPLRVTRSVGLQVSFTANPFKLARTVPKCSAVSHHRREKGGKHPNRSVHVSQPPNKKIPILPSTSPKKPLVIDSNTKFSTKSGLTITLQPASSSSETQLASKPIPIQQPKLSILPATDSPSTSLIDLTGDDERQMEQRSAATIQQTLTVGPPGQVKVVNHIQPAQNPAGAVAFLISSASAPPCCSAITTTTESQNRQLVIPGSSTQAPQRHIIPAIPTLIYKPNALIQPGSQASQARPPAAKPAKHPAPLPHPGNQIHKPNWKLLPPRPSLKISKGDTGIVLSWNMTLGPEYETIVSYQLFAYQESDAPPSSSMWKRVGDIKALRLPMACTLTQFLPGHKYYFAVRAVDMHSRVGPFSIPGSITLIR